MRYRVVGWTHIKLLNSEDEVVVQEEAEYDLTNSTFIEQFLLSNPALGLFKVKMETVSDYFE